MPSSIDHAVLQPWLTENGYDHWCFISYPRPNPKNPDRDPLAKFVSRLRDDLDQELDRVGKRKVFLDTENSGGTIWEEGIRKGLCGSIVFLPIYVPQYFLEHKWCQYEWDGAYELSKKRLRPPESSIFPIQYHGLPYQLPDPAASIQVGYDVSSATYKTNFFRSAPYLRLIKAVEKKIDSTAQLLMAGNAAADCTRFKLRNVSPFTDVEPEPRLKKWRSR